MEVKIEKLGENNKKLWGKFIEANSNSQIQHTLNWKETIENTYPNCIPYYYLYLEKNSVKAIFPFFLVKSKILGDRLISQPFLDNGGFLGKYDEKGIKKLFDILKKEFSNIEIRLNPSFENFEKICKILGKNGFSEDKSKQQFIIKLTTKEKMWKNFHKHTRNDIRKAEKSGLKLKNINNQKELNKFYKLYFQNMKFFGTPPHSYGFFKNLFREAGKNVFGFNCYYKNILIGSIIFLYKNKNSSIAFNVSNSKYYQYRANDLLYWETIQWALNHKIKYINLGQIDKNSKDARAIGLYKFKRKWLGDVYDKTYFHNRKTRERKEKKDKLKKFRNVWKKLPNSLIKIIGPKIASQLAL